MNTFDVQKIVKALHENESLQRQDLDPSAIQRPPPSYTTDESGVVNVDKISDLNSFAPMGLNDANGFENLLYLANHDVSAPWI